MAAITVYSTQTCPYCKMLKSWLEERKMSYEDKFVDEDQAAMEEMMQISEGHLGVPFSVVTGDDGTKVKIIGFDKAKFQEALGIK
ncbi:MAG: glutaredoxin family protein [Candidatus Chisholmbacteria bacterium]|nr:glutaredoxin family protein [Candidatus Chisholmbacteria bacterium]